MQLICCQYADQKSCKSVDRLTPSDSYDNCNGDNGSQSTFGKGESAIGRSSGSSIARILWVVFASIVSCVCRRLRCGCRLGSSYCPLRKSKEGQERVEQDGFEHGDGGCVLWIWV